MESENLIEKKSNRNQKEINIVDKIKKRVFELKKDLIDAIDQNIVSLCF